MSLHLGAYDDRQSANKQAPSLTPPNNPLILKLDMWFKNVRDSINTHIFMDNSIPRIYLFTEHWVRKCPVPLNVHINMVDATPPVYFLQADPIVNNDCCIVIFYGTYLIIYKRFVKTSSS